MSAEGSDWEGPFCRACGRELTPESLATAYALGVVYICSQHGPVSMASDPSGGEHWPPRLV